MVKIGSEIKVGDRVRVRPFKDEWAGQHPFFTPPMKVFCGEEFFVGHLNDYDGVITHSGFYWSQDWLELVEKEVEEDIDYTAFEAVLTGAVL